MAPLKLHFIFLKAQYNIGWCNSFLYQYRFCIFGQLILKVGA